MGEGKPEERVLWAFLNDENVGTLLIKVWQ